MTFTFRFLYLTGAANSPVQSSREIRVATAIFPTLSLLNHSCCPNTSLVFSTGVAADPSGSDVSAHLSESEAEDRSTARGVCVTVRAAKEIPAGQEILHCYGNVSFCWVQWVQNGLFECWHISWDTGVSSRTLTALSTGITMSLLPIRCECEL